METGPSLWRAPSTDLGRGGSLGADLGHRSVSFWLSHFNSPPLHSMRYKSPGLSHRIILGMERLQKYLIKAKLN